MKRTLIPVLACCSACGTPEAPIAPAELVMTTAGHGSECIIMIGGQSFVTKGLESVALAAHLRRVRPQTVTLQFVADAPYRCIGSAIIMLQRAKVKHRVPQLQT